jgi:hypothetical protein
MNAAVNRVPIEPPWVPRKNVESPPIRTIRIVVREPRVAPIESAVKVQIALAQAGDGSQESVREPVLI